VGVKPAGRLDYARREVLAELGAFDRVKTRLFEDFGCACWER
jgi:hypothetical protein